MKAQNNEQPGPSGLAAMSNEALEQFFLEILRSAAERLKWPEFCSDEHERQKLSAALAENQASLSEQIDSRSLRASRNLGLIMESFGSLRSKLLGGPGPEDGEAFPGDEWQQ